MQTATDITQDHMLPARLPRGFELGGCVVDGWLRDGGMAAIYRARRTLDERRVALKVQLPSTAGDPSICARFDREAEVMARANGSPHVAELYHAGVLDDGRRFFVLEWVEGENLEELLDYLRNQDQRMPLERACRIGRDIARGLSELHEHGVLHLDLKPSNVMVGQAFDERDEIKLVDFGIAADLHEAAESPEAAGAAVMGTSGYMCPEQVLGSPASPSFDVYAFGVLLFEVISGISVPPDGWKPETLPRLEALRRGVPAALAELVRACMDFDPQRRPASAAAVTKELGRILRALESEGGARRVSTEDVPVRTGGTELVPQSSAVKAAAAGPSPARTGGTEVVRTHEEVLLQSGLGTGVTPEVLDAVRRSAAQVGEPARARSRASWLALCGVGVLVVGAVWAWSGSGSDGTSSEAVAAEETRPAEGVDERGHDRAKASMGAVAPSAPGVAEGEDIEAPTLPLPAEPSPADVPAKLRGGGTRGGGSSAEACRKARADAEAAKALRRWPQVLKATASRGCWTTAAQRLERKRLRVEAYAESGEPGDFRKCVAEGGRSRDSQVAARVKLCRKHVAEERAKSAE